LAAAARRADLVITVSRSAAAEIEAHSAISADRLRIVPKGVDHVVATPEETAAARTRLGLDGAPYLLWVGTLEPRKNVTTLVQAFARVVESGEAGDLRLVLAGPSGWLSRDLVPGPVLDRLGGPGPDGRVRLLGQLAEPQLRALYAGATLFVLPSRHEGFGLPVLEAMVQGTPVVCADIAALREVAGDAARFVAPDDVDGWAGALGRLIGDDAARRQLSEAGRTRAAQFSWEQTVRQTRAVYAEALEQVRGRGR
jgi:alpha-1,3-rhamnosyl/mannosyltransferase